MLKNLIIVLIMVIILAIGLNFDTLFPTQERRVIQKQEEKRIPLKKMFEESSDKLTMMPIETNVSCKKHQEENLTSEIKKLLEEAHLLFRDSKDAQALELYKRIIQKTQNSSNLKIIEQFTEACMQMAFLYQIYPNSDTEMAIDTYSILINKFENSKNSKLLEYYITAKIQQAYLFDKEERAEVYDELINKFENSNDKKLQKRVEELLINKSFELMGKEDEEAMDILDKLINKYEKKNEKEKLPEAIEMAILNNLELSIITSNDDEKYVDLANKYLSDSPHSKPLVEMLEIIKNAQYLEQENAVNQWKEEYENYYFDDWSFEEMKRWMNTIEDKETQKRVKKYINEFENYKYNQGKKGKNLEIIDLSAKERFYREENLF